MGGFIIWALIGAVIITLGIRSFTAKKPVGFWANVETGKVNDVKGYNHATGKLFTVYGIVFILFGLPLLAEQKMPLTLLSIFGVVFETIAAMAVYSTFIEKKYHADK